ncbi:MAG: radical SAM protein [Candidatus Omnitrophica bacterium]|nr:radical SAM protein [Candidatus Omnitrophota bacterium]
MYNQQVYLENKKHNQTEIAQAKVILASKIRRLMVVLTSRCNINCIMCERRLGDFTLSRAAVEQIIEFFPYLDSIMWQGGEVFLVDYFEELFEKAAGYPHLIQEINTNGLLITQNWARMIARANVRLILSIDSIDKEIYEYIRKGAKFETLIHSLSLLKEVRSGQDKNNIAYIINVVVMRSNYQGLDDFVDFALKYGFGSINFMCMSGKQCPQENIFDPIDKKAIDYLTESIPRIIDKSRLCGLNINCEFAKYLFQVEAPVIRNSLNTCPETLFCSMPWRSLFIDEAQQGGKFYPECLCIKPAG